MNVGQIIRERMRDRSKDEKFPLTHMPILLFVAENPNPLMKDVSDFLGITPPSATTLVNNLVKAGQIKRIPDKKDRRVIRLALTAKGEKNLKEKVKKVKMRTRKILAQIGKEKRKNLISILEKLPEIL